MLWKAVYPLCVLMGKPFLFPIHRNIKFQNLQIILYISVKKVLNPILPQCNEGLFKTFLAMCIHSDPANNVFHAGSFLSCAENSFSLPLSSPASHHLLSLHI